MSKASHINALSAGGTSRQRCREQVRLATGGELDLFARQDFALLRRLLDVEDSPEDVSG
jgi:hypothetical protein